MLNHRIITFLTLYKEMNYRKTAEKLNMTQPGVTQHIKYLEDFYKVKLFEYDGRNLTKTPNADILKKHMSAIYQQEQELLKEFKHTDKLLTLNVGATKTVGEYIISPIVCRFLSVENHILNLTVDNTHTLLDLLDKGLLDFALIEGSFDKSKYEHHLFRRERFAGVCAKNHKFAGKTVDWNELFGENLILRENGSGTREIFEHILHDAGYRIECFKTASSISNFSLIQRLVSMKLGITFAYHQIVDSDETLTSFEIEGISVASELNYVYSNSYIAAQKIRQFMGDIPELSKL